MPGTSYDLPAQNCITGSQLAKRPGTVCSQCYALKNKYLWRKPLEGMHKRFRSLWDKRWVDAMTILLLHTHSAETIKHRRGENQPGFHRWHSAGDLQGVWHLQKIIDVCIRTPEIQHWLPTREVHILRDYLNSGGVIPRNLTVRVSSNRLDQLPTDGVFTWPQTSTVHHKAPPLGYQCPAPTQGNACVDCRACWSREVRNVSYKLH